MKRKKKWIKFRHRVVRNLAYAVMWPYSKLKYNIKIERFKREKNQPYLILLNHQTPLDQFFVGMSVSGPIYYLATEDIFSNGWVSSLIRWLVAPIPIKKQTTDVTAVINCIRVAKEGGTIAIAPEGNRTYSGKTEYMNPAIAPLAKKLKLPILLYRIEGGYGSEPRWCDKVRRGKMRAYVSRVITPQEYKDMSNEELFDIIEKGLFVDEGVADCEFLSSKRAEYLERAFYVCPFCGLSKFESHGNEAECLTCHKKITYGTDKTLKGVGFDFSFEFTTEWYEYQKDFVNGLDVMQYLEKPLFCDTASVHEVIVNKSKNIIYKDADIKLFGDRIEIISGKEQKIFNFKDTSAVSVLGRNKLNIYFDGNVYQLKGDKRFNALKYVNIYYRNKNIIKGDEDGEFLGL